MSNDHEATFAPTLADRWRQALQIMAAAVVRELEAYHAPRRPESLAGPSDDQLHMVEGPNGPKSCEDGSNPRSGECADPCECE